jgi:hypothetical protein
MNAPLRLQPAAFYRNRAKSERVKVFATGGVSTTPPRRHAVVSFTHAPRADTLIVLLADRRSLPLALHIILEGAPPGNAALDDGR